MAGDPPDETGSAGACQIAQIPDYRRSVAGHQGVSACEYRANTTSRENSPTVGMRRFLTAQTCSPLPLPWPGALRCYRDVIAGLAGASESAVDHLRCLRHAQSQVGARIFHDPAGLKEQQRNQMMRFRESVGSSHGYAHATGVCEVEMQLSQCPLCAQSWSLANRDSMRESGRLFSLQSGGQPATMRELASRLSDANVVQDYLGTLKPYRNASAFAHVMAWQRLWATRAAAVYSPTHAKFRRTLVT